MASTQPTRPANLPDPDLDKKLDDAFGPGGAWSADPNPAVRHVSQWRAGWTNTLDEALAWLQLNLPRVAKGETAEVVKDGRKLYDYQYADLTDVSEAVLPLLGKLGLSWRCVPTMVRLEGETGWRFVLKYTLRHVGGSEITGMWPLPDRANPQEIGSVVTYARRYCLCAVTGLAPGGDDDGGAAKDGSRRGEPLSEASTLSLPPADTERLVAALEPAALTPLAEYPELWKTVTARRAAVKPSPVEHEGKLLSWAELFGNSLAQRIEALTTREECLAFFEQARAIGGDAALPWAWEGTLAGARLKARGIKVKADRDERIKIASAALDSASSLAELDRAVVNFADLFDRMTATSDEQTAGLLGIERNRRRELETTAAIDRVGEPAEEPDPWAAPGEASAAHDLLFAHVWKGAPLAELMGDVDGAFEREEITGDEHAGLHSVLQERPEPGPEREAYDFLQWQAETAPNTIALEEVNHRIAIIRGAERLDGRQARTLYGAVSARRTELMGDRNR
jgi:hypothetical protein